MRIVILLAIGIISFVIVFVPGYFLFVPRDSESLAEQTQPVEGMEEVQESEVPEAPGEEPPMGDPPQ